MIAYVKGRLAASGEDSIVVETTGLGYEISVHQRVLAGLPPVGSEIIIYTYYQVLESEVRLYGFLSQAEQALFKKIITVSGFGARGAMSILSVLTPGDFVRAVVSGDEKRLCAVPGIGKKSAQRLIFELKERLGSAMIGGAEIHPADISAGGLAGESRLADDLLDALEALGYGRSEVVGAVSEVLAESDSDIKVEAALRQVLKKLAR